MYLRQLHTYEARRCVRTYTGIIHTNNVLCAPVQLHFEYTSFDCFDKLAELCKKNWIAQHWTNVLVNGFKGGWGAYSSIGIEVLNGIIVFLQCIFVIGLRLIGQKMADPYGDDHEDLSVKTYVETTLHICRIIFTTEGTVLNK